MQTSLSQVKARPAVAVRVPASVPGFSRRALLVQVLACVGPAMVLFGSGQMTAAGYCFWGVLGLVLARLVVVGRLDELLCVLIAVMPVVNLLREFAIYNIIIVMEVTALTWYACVEGRTLSRIWGRYRLGLLLWAGTIVYYGFSLLFTRNYAVNLRLFELSLTVLCVLVIGRHRALLSGMLAGLCLAVVVVGLAFLSQSEMAVAGRLGMIVVDGHSFGNPIQLGLPLALAFLALAVDGGHWLSVARSRFWRWGLLVVSFALLAMTTSRAAWMIAVMGVLVSLVFGARQRLRMIVMLAVIAGGGQLLLLTPVGDGFQRGLQRTVGGSMAHRTSGRSDQWQVAYAAVTASPSAFLHGYGPGQGGEVYARFSREVPGVRYAVGEKVALHSLFMQVAVETGVVGALFLVAWLAVAGVKVLAWTRRHRVVFPLVCFTGYVMVVVTVSGNDTTSATLLGIGLLAAGPRDA